VWIDLTVILAADEASAAEEFAAVWSPGYEPCLLERVEQMTADYVADDAGPARSSFGSRIALDVGAPAIADRTVSQYLAEDGSIRRQHIVFVRMQIGRAIVRMPLTSFLRAVTSEEVERLAHVVHDRVASTLALED